GNEEDGQLGLAAHLGGRPQQVPLVGVGKPVVEGGAAQAVAVGDLDDGDTGGVEGGDDGPDLVGGELMGQGVGPVPQGGVGEAEISLGPAGTPISSEASASPTCTAEAVMMSRFP